MQVSDRVELPLVEDEIPGHTTYLYGKNRFRKPEETVNHWKRESEATELSKRLGIEKLDTIELVELVAEMDRRLTGLQEDMEAETKKSEDLRTRLNKTIQAQTKAEQEKVKAEDEARDALDEKSKAEIYADRRHEEVVKYGDHMVGCAWLEATYSGRRLSPKMEEELCSCGWMEIKKQL